MPGATTGGQAARMTPRWIELDGTANTRDVGGLPTIGGQQTAPGRLLRSDNLADLSDRDVALLVNDYGVRSIVDLRAQAELDAEGETPLARVPGMTTAHLSLFPEGSGPPTAEEAASNLGRTAGPNAFPGYSGLYFWFLTERADSVLAALRVIAHSESPILVHCTAGKDRTGVIVALALDAVGVQRDAVLADYAASGERVGAVLSRLAFSPDPELAARASEPRNAPRRETMQRFFALVDEHLGGASGWLRSQGWTDADQLALHRSLISVP